MVLMTRTDAFERIGTCHARQLAWARARLSVRPVVAMPTSPTPTAIHRVELGWLKAVSI